MRGPSRREDARSLAAIIGGGLLAVVGTALVAASISSADPPPPRHQVVRVRIQSPTPRHEVVRARIESPSVTWGASDRIFGRVETKGGAVHTGLIRWDRNEGSWADVLDATKAGRTAGLRFGHIRSLEPTGPASARVALRSGGVVELAADATDLGTSLRSLVVTDPTGGSVELHWQDLERVDFEAAPVDVRPGDGRLHGTLRTRSGAEFTGYLTWDVEEIYTSDLLDGRDRQGTRRIPFGAVAAIERRDLQSAVVTLIDGSRVTLRSSDDIGTANRGITVSDPGLGEVKLPWSQFASVRFHRPEPGAARDGFGGPGTIRGTVLAEDGRAFTGLVVWDRDESATWEMINGSEDGVEFQVEFGKIARIRKTGSGAVVELRDGRSYHLSGSNDVGPSNNGIMVGGEGRIVDLSWSEFSELRIEPTEP